DVIEKLWRAYQQLHAQPAGPRVLAIVGASGSGKSSLARAGLVPALRRRPVPGPLAPQAVIFTPGERPIERLARALLPLALTKDEGLAAARLLELKQLLGQREPG